MLEVQYSQAGLALFPGLRTASSVTVLWVGAERGGLSSEYFGSVAGKKEISDKWRERHLLSEGSDVPIRMPSLPSAFTFSGDGVSSTAWNGGVQCQLDVTSHNEKQVNERKPSSTKQCGQFLFLACPVDVYSHSDARGPVN